MIGMYWGTVILSLEPKMDPPKRFKKNATKFGFTENDINNLYICYVNIDIIGNKYNVAHTIISPSSLIISFSSSSSPFKYLSLSLLQRLLNES